MQQLCFWISEYDGMCEFIVDLNSPKLNGKPFHFFLQDGAIAAFASGKSTTDVCAIKNHNVKSQWGGDTVLMLLNFVDPLLVLRVPEQNYFKLVNLAKVVALDTTNKEIENALVSSKRPSLLASIQKLLRNVQKCQYD